MTAVLVLGTAQFGSDYGIANRSGQVDAAGVSAILDGAAAAGIETLDTAPAYGCAEQVLGDQGARSRGFAVVTKTPTSGDQATVRQSVERSLLRLRRDRLDALLVHDRRRLLWADGDALFAELADLRTEGVVGRIGVSVYHPDEAAALTDRYPLDIVQLPLNVFDQRAHSTGLLAHLAGKGVEVHARSALLQGLLVLHPGQVPMRLAASRVRLRAFRDRARTLRVNPLAAALGFVKAIPGVARVVCGVDNPAQLAQTVAAHRTQIDPGDFADLASHDLALIDPSQWSDSREAPR